MDRFAPSRDLLLAIRAVEAAAQAIRASYGKRFEIRDKAKRKEVVTQVDRQAEDIIRDVLLSGSDHSLLGEESGRLDRDVDTTWVIDPLDGTTNFSRGIPVFASSVALCRAAEVLVGVIVNPITEEVFSAEASRGAYLNGKRIHASSVHKNPIVFVNNGYGEEDERRAGVLASRLATRCSLRQLGTTALELALVSKGSAEGFICSGDEIWDYAAGMRIAEEAGAIVSDWTGQPLSHENAYLMVSANRAVYDLLHDNAHDLQ